MIVGDKRNWLGMVFSVRGSILPHIWPRIAVVTVFAMLVTWLQVNYETKEYSLTTTPFTLIGLAMAIFLGFRNNEAYDRYWEGRTLWGKLVNVSRSFTRQSLIFIGSNRTEGKAEVGAIRRRLAVLNIAFVNALRHQLRGTDPKEDLATRLSLDEVSQVICHSNRPLAVLHLMGLTVRQAWQAGYVHDFHVGVLEDSLSGMTDVQGGCERIKGTPIPFTYNVLIHRIVAIYCFALPLGLVDTVGLLTPIVVCFISYAFFGLDAIGDEVEQPFETDDNDLPLEAICRTIEINLLQLLGEEDVPPPIEAVKGVLL